MNTPVKELTEILNKMKGQMVLDTKASIVGAEMMSDEELELILDFYIFSAELAIKGAKKLDAEKQRRKEIQQPIQDENTKGN